MEEVKLAVASNLIKLRTAAGMTQTDLGAKLNYSDKTISKWERADALPDVAVLKQIADLFEVSVDYLLGAHDPRDKPASQSHASTAHAHNCRTITMLSIAGIWTLAVLGFVIVWMLGSMQWLIFVYAVPVSLITHLVLNSVWHSGKNNFFLVAALVLCIIAVIYLTLLKYQLWQLFLVVIPAELVVYLSFRIKKVK